MTQITTIDFLKQSMPITFTPLLWYKHVDDHNMLFWIAPNQHQYPYWHDDSGISVGIVSQMNGDDQYIVVIRSIPDRFIIIECDVNEAHNQVVTDAFRSKCIKNRPKFTKHLSNPNKAKADALREYMKTGKMAF